MPAQRIEGLGGRARALAVDLEKGAAALAGRVLDAVEALVDQRQARFPGLEPRGDVIQRSH